MLNFNVITLFPDIFENHLKHLPMKRAVKESLVKINLIELRKFAIDKRGTVDSPPYGGGPGMILRSEPIYKAIDSILPGKSVKIVFLTPRGKLFNQNKAREYASLEEIVIVCGRYEGMDQRVIDYFIEKFSAEEISIGNYVLSGGEIPAMVIMESVVRLIPGAIENSEALENESFNGGKTEHPQYTRPEKWLDRKVPEVLLKGHHENINRWKLDLR